MPNSMHAQEALAFSERLRKALERAGMRPSPTLVANEFNLRYYGRAVTAHTVRNWLLGTSIPAQDKLQTLAQWLEVDPHELRFGPSGRMLTLRESSPLEARLRHADFEMIERYLGLPPESQRTVREVVLGLSVAHAARQAGGKPASR